MSKFLYICRFINYLFLIVYILEVQEKLIYCILKFVKYCFHSFELQIVMKKSLSVILLFALLLNWIWLNFKNKSVGNTFSIYLFSHGFPQSKKKNYIHVIFVFINNLISRYFSITIILFQDVINDNYFKC